MRGRVAQLPPMLTTMDKLSPAAPRLQPEPAAFRTARGPAFGGEIFRRDRSAWRVPPRDTPCPSAAGADLRKLVSRPYQQDQVAQALRAWLPRRDWGRTTVVDGMAHVGTDTIGLFVERLGAGRVAPIEIHHEFAELLAENVRAFPAVDFPRCGDFYALWPDVVRGAADPIVYLDPMWTPAAIGRALAEIPALLAAGAAVVLKLPPGEVDAAAAAGGAGRTHARWVAKTWPRRRGERDFAVVLVVPPAVRPDVKAAAVPEPHAAPAPAPGCWRACPAAFPALTSAPLRIPQPCPSPGAGPSSR
jgi:hypothetical protein